jgi:hypothetical protein
MTWLCAVDGRSMGVERMKDGVWVGVWCPLTRGVDHASRKCDWVKSSVLGVFNVASGNVADFGVEEGLGRCQSVDLIVQGGRLASKHVKVEDFAKRKWRRRQNLNQTGDRKKALWGSDGLSCKMLTGAGMGF